MVVQKFRGSLTFRCGSRFKCQGPAAPLTMLRLTPDLGYTHQMRIPFGRIRRDDVAELDDDRRLGRGSERKQNCAAMAAAARVRMGAVTGRLFLLIARSLRKAESFALCHSSIISALSHRPHLRSRTSSVP